MRLVSWNVACSLAKKFHMLESLEPDVAIIAESANEARLLRDGVDGFSSMGWIGRYSYKGLAVLGFGGWKVKMLEKEWDQRLEWVLPFNVSGPAEFTAFAVWSQNSPGSMRYPSTRAAFSFDHVLEAYRPELTDECVIAGDFNHHTQWDKGDPAWDFSSTLDRFSGAGLTSAWHSAHDVPVGDPGEPPTHWLQYNENKPYMIDYCFVPEAWADRIANVWIGSYAQFGSGSPRSDHAPIVVDIHL